MNKVYNFLFPAGPCGEKISWILLAIRVVFGILLMTHGIQKIMNFSELSQTFPDPLGVGSTISVSLVIFAEVACSLGFIFGFLYRLALIPILITMFVVFFIISADSPFNEKELPFAYLMIYVIMYIAGPGSYSIDHLFVKKMRD